MIAHHGIVRHYETSPPPPSARLTVLVLDDQPTILRSLRRLLHARGCFEVLAAETSAEALALVDRGPDIALVDLHLAPGDINGIECTRRLRTAGFGGSICILTGDTSPDQLLEALHAGADGYLIKPCAEIHTELERLISAERGRSSAPLELREQGRAYLRSRGRSQHQIDLCATWAARGFPDLGALAAELNIEETTLAGRFARIREALGLRTNSALSSLLTILCMYGARL
jgi:CheY-like chemotaxis protein